MKKVLVISYYWPPAGGAGVQRWLKFIKYMRFFQWEPVVYTALNAEMPVVDESLLKDVPAGITVVKRHIWEPYSFYKRFSGKGKAEKINPSFLSEKKGKTLREKISIWIRGNFFIPDARRYWIKPSITYLEKYLQAHEITHVISTGPPHSMHMIALGLKRRMPSIKWVADFRDPWTNIDFYAQLMLGRKADRLHHEMELQVLRHADLVLGIGETMKNEFLEIYESGGGKDTGKFHVITNGFDSADLVREEVKKDRKFSIAHIGTLVKDRNPTVLWRVLRDLVAEMPAFRAALEIKLVGKVDYHVKQAISSHNLDLYVKYIDYMPHNEVMAEQLRSKILLLLVNNTKNARGIVTGKAFEYMATGVPILAIGPVNGDLAQILKETRSGLISEFDDAATLKKHIIGLYAGEVLTPDPEAINRYSRHELTKRLCDLLDKL